MESDAVRISLIKQLFFPLKHLKLKCNFLFFSPLIIYEQVKINVRCIFKGKMHHNLSVVQLKKKYLLLPGLVLSFCSFYLLPRKDAVLSHWRIYKP